VVLPVLPVLLLAARPLLVLVLVLLLQAEVLMRSLRGHPHSL